MHRLYGQIRGKETTRANAQHKKLRKRIPRRTGEEWESEMEYHFKSTPGKDIIIERGVSPASILSFSHATNDVISCLVISVSAYLLRRTLRITSSNIRRIRETESRAQMNSEPLFSHPVPEVSLLTSEKRRNECWNQWNHTCCVIRVALVTCRTLISLLSSPSLGKESLQTWCYFQQLTVAKKAYPEGETRKENEEGQHIY